MDRKQFTIWSSFAGLAVGFLLGQGTVKTVAPEVKVEISGLESFIRSSGGNDMQLAKWEVETRNRLNKLEQEGAARRPLLPDAAKYKEMR